MTALMLNHDQEVAAQKIFQFLLSEDKEFSLSGPAGTGKTTLMKHIMTHLLPDYEDACKLLGTTPHLYEIQLTATTNKATEVLAQATGFPAQTIHNFLGLKVYNDHKTGVSRIDRTRKWTVHHKKLIFIDEASMVQRELYNFINQGTDATCKIIYLGDRCQMAPVGEKISPVYENQKNTAELLIPVRNAEQPALMALCDQLRRNVDDMRFPPIQEVPGVIDYLNDHQAKDFIDNTFANEISSARVLGYTNSRIIEYNEYIRNLRGYPDNFIQGERVINNISLEVPGNMLRVEEEFTISKISATPRTITFDNGNAEIGAFDGKIQNARCGEVKVLIPESSVHLKELSRYYGRQKNWNVYFWLKNHFVDLRPKDAATVYKAQGSTYETVFLDLGNIGKCTSNDQVARMLYVGASRATTRLCLYGQLPPRFQELQHKRHAIV